jgi:hypothetical protein
VRVVHTHIDMRARVDLVWFGCDRAELLARDSEGAATVLFLSDDEDDGADDGAVAEADAEATLDAVLREVLDTGGDEAIDEIDGAGHAGRKKAECAGLYMALLTGCGVGGSAAVGPH